MKKIIAILLLISQVTIAQNWDIPANKKDFHIFLLMGQSNMSGYAPLLPGDKDSIPQVLFIPTTGQSENYAWKPGAHPLHNRRGTDRFGLGIDFAKTYLLAHPDVTVGFIPVANGGSAIAGLQKGTNVYKDAMAKAKWAKSIGVIKGVLWHQGESDTVKKTLSDSYQSKLDKLVTDVRVDLEQDSLLFIAGNLAEFYGTSSDHNAPDRVERIVQIRSTLRDLPNRMSFTGFVESTDLKSFDKHNVHFDRDSYITFGKRYAKRYLALEDSLKPVVSINQRSLQKEKILSTAKFYTIEGKRVPLESNHLNNKKHLPHITFSKENGTSSLKE